MLFGKLGRMLYALDANFYDSYKYASEDYGTYKTLAESNLDIEVGLYQLIMNAVTYASGAAVLLSAITLILASKDKGSKLAEAKNKILRALIVSILIFSVAGGMNFIQGLAPK